jgi:hypothetical protein
VDALKAQDMAAISINVIMIAFLMTCTLSLLIPAMST